MPPEKRYRKYSPYTILPMIIKSISHKSISHKKTINYRVFLDYILDEHKQGNPKQGWRIVQNIDCIPSDTQGLEQAFRENAKYKRSRKGGVTLFHDVISSSAASGATPETMYELTQHYLAQRNAKGGLAVAALHQDKDHLHCHIMLSANVRGSEKSMSISRKEFYQIREDFERKQVELGLTQDIVYLPEYKRSKTKGERSGSDAERHIKKRGRDTHKQHLRKILEKAFENARDKIHFFSLVNAHDGVQVYHRNSNPTGINFNNRKYRFTRLMDKHELEQKFSILDRLEELSHLHGSQERDRHTLER